jgi:hypothetical protein
MSTFGPKGQQPFDGAKMPPATQDYFKIAVNRIEPKIMRERTGLNRTHAYNLMRDVTNRLVQNSDGTWALPGVLTKAEEALVRCVCSQMVVRPAFEADRLCDDFIETLKSNGLITKQEIRSHKETFCVLIQLYAVAMMHNCVVQVGDGTTIKLLARPEPDIKEIQVNAPVANAIAHMPHVDISSSMFRAKVDPAEHCQPGLLATKEWDFEIELAPDKRLARL